MIDRWLRASRAKSRLDSREVFEQWGEVVGGEIARHTRVIDFESGRLTVEVNSSALLQELATYYRPEIVQALRESGHFRGLRDIRFRAGAFESRPADPDSAMKDRCSREGNPE